MRVIAGSILLVILILSSCVPGSESPVSETGRPDQREGITPTSTTPQQRALPGGDTVSATLGAQLHRRATIHSRDLSVALGYPEHHPGVGRAHDPVGRCPLSA